MTDKEILKKAEEIKKAKKKRGLTDRVFIAVAVFTVAAFIFSAVLMWVTKDTSGLAYFIPSVAGFGTIVLTAIVAKNANDKKYQFGSQDVVDRIEEDNR